MSTPRAYDWTRSDFALMNYIFAGMIMSGIIIGALSGNMEAVSATAISESARAIDLMLVLVGNMCLWSGIMKLAEASGITKLLSIAFSPLTRFLFRGLKPGGKAVGAITMNMAANLLGLGNAATPLGMAAMRAMEEEQRHPHSASDDMCMFVTLNTASLQIIPTTAAMLRAAAGSVNPMEILPATWLASSVSVISGIIAVRVLGKLWRSKRNGH